MTIQQISQELDKIVSEQEVLKLRLRELSAEQSAINDHISAIGMFDSSRTDETLHELLRRQRAIDMELVRFTYDKNQLDARLVKLTNELFKALAA